MGQIKSQNDNIQNMTADKQSPLEIILNAPGLLHISENIFNNLDYKDLEVCRNINRSSQQILDNPMFWLRKFGQLSKKNKKDWIKVIQSVKNSSKKKKAIISYLQWNLKKEVEDFPCYTSPAVQDIFREKIWKSCQKQSSSKRGLLSSSFANFLPSFKGVCNFYEKHLKHEDTEIVKVLAPLTENPNAPNENGVTPIHRAAYHGYSEIVKILVPLTDNPNAPDVNGRTPIYCAANRGHTEIVKILVPLTYNPNTPDEHGRTPLYWAAYGGHTEIFKILAPLTGTPNSPDDRGKTPLYWATVNRHFEIIEILRPLIGLQS